MEKTNDSDTSPTKCSSAEIMAAKNGSSNPFSQSKLFKHDTVQSSLSASNSEKLHGKFPASALSGLPMHPSQAAMLYQQSFLPVHPLGLPIMPQIPMGIPPFFPPTSPLSDKQSFRPNIMRSSPASNHRPSIQNSRDRSPLSSQHQKHRGRSSFSPPSLPSHTSHTHSRVSSSDSVQSRNSLIVPPAHSNNKQSYTPVHSSSIPTPSNHTATSKSLLFDFESPKRQKLESLNLTHREKKIRKIRRPANRSQYENFT